MERYDVYLHNIPKVSEDGMKSLPIEPPRAPKELSDLEEASRYAAAHKDEFERVVVIRTVDDKQKMVARYMDGEEIEVVVEEEPEAEEPAAAEEPEPAAAEAETPAE